MKMTINITISALIEKTNDVYQPQCDDLLNRYVMNTRYTLVDTGVLRIQGGRPSIRNTMVG